MLLNEANAAKQLDEVASAAGPEGGDASAAWCHCKYICCENVLRI